ncbi:MAG: hypothetical protein JO243_15975 [Solirubrobacterales bacterium]|nr:hypothetical protein [Solirubrobacterales bacterium]
MVPSLLARVDGLPVSMLDREVVWPIPTGERNGHRSSMSSRHHAQTGAIAAAAVALAANLPDPHQPTIILFLAGLGALIGTAVGRIRQLPREQIREIAEDATFAGGIIGAVVYLAAVAGVFGGWCVGRWPA